MSKETLSPASLARPMILDILAASLKKDKASVLWYVGLPVVSFIYGINRTYPMKLGFWDKSLFEQ